MQIYFRIIRIASTHQLKKKSNSFVEIAELSFGRDASRQAGPAYKRKEPTCEYAIDEFVADVIVK